MKKILAISIIAMTAVTTANAQIASKAYVDAQDGQLSNLQTTAKNNLVAAINEVKGTADAALPASSVTSDYSATGTAPVTGTAVAAAIAGALESNGESVFAPADVLENLDLAANGATMATGAVSGNVITQVTQTNGQIAVVKGDAVDAVAASTGAGNVITAISLNDDGKTIDSVKGITALQQSDVAQTYDASGTAPVSGAVVASAISGAAGNYATAAQGLLADSAVQSVAEGSTNGTVAVDGTDVAVHGLGSAAYTASTDYATSTQGGKADTAVQTVATSGSGNVVTNVTQSGTGVTATLGNAIMSTDTINENGTWVLTATRTGESAPYTYTYQWELITRATPAQQGSGN